MMTYKRIALFAAAACFFTACQAFATVPVHHSRWWVGRNRLTENTNLPTADETMKRRDLLSSSLDFKRMQLFVKALHDGRPAPAGDATVAAPSHVGRSRPSSASSTTNHIKSLSHEILWHGFLATLLARFCFPRLSLSPLVITVAMSILKRKDVYTVRSHEW
jgi:hypothetical protein